MSGLRGYDAWLERPFQQELEAQEAEEDLDNRACDAAYAVVLDPEKLPLEVADNLNNEKFVAALCDALLELAKGRTEPSKVIEQEDRALASLNGALNALLDSVQGSERERLIEEDRKANETAADDLAAELHEARCRSLGIDP